MASRLAAQRLDSARRRRSEKMAVATLDLAVRSPKPSCHNHNDASPAAPPLMQRRNVRQDRDDQQAAARKPIPIAKALASENQSPNAQRNASLQAKMKPLNESRKGGLSTTAHGLRLVADKQRNLLAIAERSMPTSARQQDRDLANLVAGKLRQRATLAEEVAKTADTIEESESRLDSMKQPAAGTRLGNLVLRQSAKVFELVRSPEGHESGLPRHEIFEGLRALGLVATDAEIEDLLGGDALLDPTDLRTKFKGLQAAAAAAEGAILAQVKTCAVLRRAFQMQHNALQKALVDDEADQLLKVATDGMGTVQLSTKADGMMSVTGTQPARVRASSAAASAVVALAGACRSG